MIWFTRDPIQEKIFMLFNKCISICIYKYCDAIHLGTKIVHISEYGQKVLQSQTADKLVGSLVRAIKQSRDTRKANKAKQPALSSPSN